MARAPQVSRGTFRENRQFACRDGDGPSRRVAPDLADLLHAFIERLVAVVDHEYITDEDLPFEFHVVELDRAKSDTSLLERAMVTFERNFLVRALERNAWNVTQTARYLGVPLSTLKFKMERLEIRELARKIKK